MNGRASFISRQSESWAENEGIIASLLTSQVSTGKIETITMLGTSVNLQFNQDYEGLKIKLPAEAPCKYAYALKVTGLKINAPIVTESANSKR
jgi:hypothetical protein